MRHPHPATRSVTAPDGSTVALHDLPLVVFRLTCGHLGREYAIRRGDLVFCGECQSTKRVRAIVAS